MRSFFQVIYKVIYGKIKKARKPYAFGCLSGAICGTRTLTGASTGGLYDLAKPYFSAFLKIKPRGCTPLKIQKSYKKSYTENKKGPGREAAKLPRPSIWKNRKLSNLV